ncbi:MAG TPA: energy transducer TonB [Thermoanaerobaculia bacterium]|nr:energy transducer TonB [Thermoanaerobaculia bacterium]
MLAIFRSSFSLLFFLLASLPAPLRASDTLAQTPAPAGPPYRVEGDVMRPEKISGSPPVYTAEARKALVQGTVILQAVIDEQGNVTDVQVLKGLPAGLDQAATEAVKTWKFNPATQHGRPVPVYYTLTVNFTMETDLTFGPLFSKFVEENPDFGELVRARRYGQALSLLEGRDAGPEVTLARVYALSALRRLDEAWAEAQAYDGADPYEAFHQVAFAALNAAAGSRDAKARGAFLDVGLQAATRAMEAREDDKKAMITKSQLLSEKAALTTDPQRAALLYEAGELAERAGSPP